MGMFDTIKFEAPCWRCGANLPNWQSKDGPCALLILEPKDVDTFYDSCDICGAWNQFKVEYEFIRIARDEEAQTNWYRPDKRLANND
jgi:hypothetical protein